LKTKKPNFQVFKKCVSTALSQTNIWKWFDADNIYMRWLRSSESGNHRLLHRQAVGCRRSTGGYSWQPTGL